MLFYVTALVRGVRECALVRIGKVFEEFRSFRYSIMGSPVNQNGKKESQWYHYAALPTLHISFSMVFVENNINKDIRRC